MNALMHVALATLLLLLLSGLSAVLPLFPLAPNLLLPMVLYYGVTPDVSLARGASLAFAAGLLTDEITGAPLGLSTFTFVACFLLTRVAGLRLFLRGIPFQIAATAGIAMIVSGVMLSLSAIFEPPEVFPLEMHPSGVLYHLATWVWGDAVPLIGRFTLAAALLVLSSITTGLVSPLVYAATRRVDGSSGRAHRDVSGEAART